MNGKSLGPRRQQGAALVIGLILLVVLTILAVSGVFTSTMELRMVRNTQSQEHAFQAAEVAIEDALANPVLSTSAVFNQATIAVPNSTGHLLLSPSVRRRGATRHRHDRIQHRLEFPDLSLSGGCDGQWA
jgi:Tfp pilus assembly protein PilX